MTLTMLESKWKAALTSILEELNEAQFNKLMFRLDTIPQGVKSGKPREDIPFLIIQYYGTEESIFLIDKEMKLLPRNDAAVQQLLRPFVEKLKKRQQQNKGRKSKITTGSESASKKPKPAAGKMSQVAANAGSVAKKPNLETGTTNQVAVDFGSVAKKLEAGHLRSYQPDLKKNISQLGTKASVAALSTPMREQVSGPSKMVPVGAVKPQQMVEQDSPLKPTGPIKTKVQSAAVQTGMIKIIGIKSTNKTNTHFVVKLNDKLQNVFVKTQLLANVFSFKVDNDFMERVCCELPLYAEAKIQGNKITDIRKL